MRSLEQRLARAARTRAHGPRGERFAARFSSLGQHGAAWLAIGALGQWIDSPRRAQWRRACACVAGSYAINTVIKLAVRRRRPRLAGLPALVRTPTGLGFPSAHATTSFAGARCYAHLGLPAAPLYGLATGLSLSRLYLGVHYPSDVLAGALLGTALAGRFTRARSDRAGRP